MRARSSGTISQRAGEGLDAFLAQAVRSCFAPSGADCAVQTVDQASATEREMVMFTISSYLFRAVMFIHFDRDFSTRGHFATLAGTNVQEMDGERFLDAVMERGNLCCGALNRDLAQFYPHTGMSTPCVVDRLSLQHLAALQPTTTRHYRAEVAPGVALHFTLTLCAFGDMDFAYVPRAVEETETAGELEMF